MIKKIVNFIFPIFTLIIMKKSLAFYNTFLNDISSLIDRLKQLDLDQESKKRVSDFHSLLLQYRSDAPRLQNLIADFSLQSLNAD